jgi:hypothetical protein
MDIPRRRLMNRKRWIIALSTAFIMSVGFVWFVYRPWALYWGATAEEINRAMPGDSAVQDPTFNATRGITIHAPPADIWPWLVQMGYHRGGYYSYDRLDNGGIPSADSIIPIYQDLKAGDLIPLTRTGRIRVGILEPERFLVLFFRGNAADGGFRGATWATGLYRIGPSETRMVTRLRARPVGALQRAFMDLCEIIMMRKHMLGVKERAERLSRMTAAERLE